MTVFCDAIECKKNHNGQCENRYVTGENAVKMHMNWDGEFICTDMDAEETEGEQ